MKRIISLAAILVLACAFCADAAIILNQGRVNETEIQGNYTLDSGSFYWNVIVSGTSVLTVTNATINGLAVTEQSQVFVKGGELQDRVSVRENATATIYAGQYLVGGQVINSMNITQISDGNPFFGNITIYPEIGDSYTSSFSVNDSGLLILAPLPEPATMLIFGLGGLLLRKRFS